MPLYEYACKNCGKRFECLVSPGKESEVVCDKCGSADVRKLISGFGIGGGGSRIKASSSGCKSCSSGSCSTCH
ncbi:MAG: zinc ribbon protein [Candidatus Aminicenantes bacterium]|jgi:putative FmdB family regulatory protein|nr:zinc ribbon protein [Candidatus Aminicenantes bacterium]MBS1226192.1 zinc ribbon protein [Candidatus Aminicenantes bacterium]